MKHKTKIKYTNWETLPLWKYQKGAVNMVVTYLRSKSKGAALIRMPTGTGKSGVIAVLARCFETSPNVLVVVPWYYLREQLKRDIKERFWTHIIVEVNSLPDKIIQSITPSTIETILKDTRNKKSIFICTIQTLQDIHSKDNQAYNLLKKRISLVIVDEGHREPAPEWSKAVRELKKPTVLLTATPYRNDHKMFNVDPNYIFAYTHQDAVKEKYIREVKFHEVDFGNSPEDFVDKLIAFYNKINRYKNFNGEIPRVIVRCETNVDVNKIASLLINKNQKVIAIHERFPKKGSAFHRKNVPNPQKTSAIFWVHQYKLIEGIDDPRFRFLAIYQPFRNARALVQQIGRIIRNPKRIRNQVAYVFTHYAHRQRAFWEGYRRYEKEFESNPKLYEFRQIFDTIVEIQPEYQYFEGDYRKKIDFKSEELYRYLRYPLSTIVYEVRENFSLKTLKEEIEKEWNAKDLDIRKIENPDNNTWVFIYLSYSNSPFLFGQALLEYKQGFTIFRLKGRCLFFYDSQGNYCTWLAANTSRVDPKKLQRLFKGMLSRISEISLMNMDLGRHSIRRRTIHAHSIEETAPSLVDYAHFVSTCRGYTYNERNRQLHRYVGFTRARVSDISSQRYEYEEYIKWLDSIALALNKTNKNVLPLFARYASFTKPPSDPTPINILIDIGGGEDMFELSERSKVKNRNLYFDDLCYDIKDGKFTLGANSQKYEVNISYDSEKNVYRLNSSELEIRYVRKSSNDRIRDNLVGYLNRTQSFRIIPNTPGVIYAHSKFYRPNIPIYGKKSEFEILNMMFPINELSDIHSEKGDKCNLKGWEEGSLFYLIDNLGRGTELNDHIGFIDILVCDDGNKEIADFIAADTRNFRVIFIHAKAFKKTKKRSATSFHEVCSQVVKNLEILHPLSTRKPPNLEIWDDPWKGNCGTVKKRIRIPYNKRKDARVIWDKLHKIIRYPLSVKDVWILLGSGFSYGEFKKQVNKPNPLPEIVQIIYLLQSTWSSVSSVGARLKIFCSP